MNKWAVAGMFVIGMTVLTMMAPGTWQSPGEALGRLSVALMLWSIVVSAVVWVGTWVIRMFQPQQRTVNVANIDSDERNREWLHRGRPATMMPNGQTSVEIIEAAIAGNTVVLNFPDRDSVKAAAYTFYWLRRRRELQGKVKVSMNSKNLTVTVGPSPATKAA